MKHFCVLWVLVCCLVFIIKFDYKQLETLCGQYLIIIICIYIYNWLLWPCVVGLITLLLFQCFIYLKCNVMCLCIFIHIVHGDVLCLYNKTECIVLGLLKCGGALEIMCCNVWSTIVNNDCVNSYCWWTCVNKQLYNS